MVNKGHRVQAEPRICYPVLHSLNSTKIFNMTIYSFIFSSSRALKVETSLRTRVCLGGLKEVKPVKLKTPFVL